MRETRTSGSMIGCRKLLTAVGGDRCVHRNHRERLQASARVQSPVRCYHEPSVGGLVPRTFPELHEYASGTPGSARRARNAASAISRRIVMSNYCGLEDSTPVS
jgi:hypothetical protein